MTKKVRKLSARQKAWVKMYTNMCFGIEPMGIDDWLAGDSTQFHTWRQVQDWNTQWFEDHCQELVSELRRKS